MNARLKKLPTFETPEEEDEFWQTHSPLDYEHDPVEPTKRTFRHPLIRKGVRSKRTTQRADETVG